MSEGALQMSRPMPVNPAYRPLPDTYDEMFEADLTPRPAGEPIAVDLLSASPERINELRARADRMFLRMGVTFNVYGDDAGTERIFPFDVVPRILATPGSGVGPASPRAQCLRRRHLRRR